MNYLKEKNLIKFYELNKVYIDKWLEENDRKTYLPIQNFEKMDPNIS